MTAFTILGILTYWVMMGVVGFKLGYIARFAFDLYQGVTGITKGVNEVAAIVAFMTRDVR